SATPATITSVPGPGSGNNGMPTMTRVQPMTISAVAATRRTTRRVMRRGAGADAPVPGAVSPGLSCDGGVRGEVIIDFGRLGLAGHDEPVVPDRYQHVVTGQHSHA